MSNKTNMTLRMEPELKARAAELFRELGLDLSTATGMFFRQALQCNGLPFEVKLREPNMATYAAMEEGERMLKDPNAPRFSSVDALFADLEAE